MWIPEAPDAASPGAAPKAMAKDFALVDGARVNASVAAALDRRRHDRFFLYVHYMDVHDYKFRRIPYAGAVRNVDAAVGGLLRVLEARGLLAGASVIFTSDHGEHLGEVHAIKGGGLHNGNPSFLPVLEIPLIVAPPSPVLAGREATLVRSQDLGRWIGELAGLESSGDSGDESEGELFVGEQFFRTFHDGRFKSSMRRSDGSTVLFDVAADPGEERDISARHPEVVRAHLVKTSQLARRLRTDRDPARALSARDRARLRALGYLE